MNKKKKENETDSAVTVLTNLPVEEIVLSELNPRKLITESEINELAESIRNQGLLQPITVRPSYDGLYEIVCGERRYRAMKLLGWTTVPAIVRTLTDAEALDAMITENLQRKDVRPTEECNAFLLLAKQGQSVTELAARFGKSESYIRGRMSLDALILELRKALQEERLSLGAALKVARLKEETQRDFYLQYVDNEDNELKHIGINEADEFVDNSSLSLEKVNFLGPDKEEVLNQDSFPHCINCPYCSTSQMSLFPEMNGQSCCLNEECYERKLLAYQEHFLETWAPKLVPAGVVPQRGDIALYYNGYSYGKHSKRMKELAERYKKEAYIYTVYQYSFGSEVADEDCVRVIDLCELVNGRDPWRRFRPSMKSSTTQQETSWSVRSAIGSLKLNRDTKVADALRPVFLEYCTADVIKTSGRLVLDAVIADMVYSCMSFANTEFKELLADKEDRHQALREWVEQHDITDLIAMVAVDIVQHGSTSRRHNLLCYLTQTLCPTQAAAAVESINATFNAKLEKLEAKYRQLKEQEDERNASNE